jgi:hypothetical protein
MLAVNCGKPSNVISVHVVTMSAHSVELYYSIITDDGVFQGLQVMILIWQRKVRKADWCHRNSSFLDFVRFEGTYRKIKGKA